MHHLYPLAKGDPLCPLGFHPQVRWPTRCKRCFRDYKEHGGRKKEEDMTVSTPSLSTWNSGSRNREDRSPSVESSSTGGVRGWVSSQNLNQEPPREKTDTFTIGLGRGGASWTSTPDLGAAEDARAVTVSLTLPKKRPTPPDTGQKRPTLAPITVETETQSVVVLRRPASTPPPSPPAHMLITKNDSLAERVRKMKALKEHNSFDKESSLERDSKTKEKPREKSMDKEKTPEIKVVKPPAVSKVSVKPSVKPSDSTKENDVNFLIKVKSARQNASRPPIRGGPTKEMVNGNKDKDYSDGESNQEDDNMSTAGTTTTETTLIDHNNFDYQEQIESLKEEVETLRKRCERVEKEKSDILLRRLASLDSGPAKTTGRPSESLKLQQKINELTVQNEDLKDEKKSLALRVRETEAELESRPSTEAATRQAEQLRSKLLAAETLCEELMDENEDMKRELRSMEEEIEEMQDNFREDQADEYSTLRKELELTTKNCRVLSFKLKKTERKAEQLELEKKEHEKKLIELAGGPTGMDRIAKIKKLEADLAMSNEVAMRLQRELQEASTKLSTTTSSGPLTSGKRAPPLQAVGKSLSSDAKPSRASLTRGGSQEDPQQLLRDLQDSLEREADLREQLKNAEEEGASLRKKASRVEDDNESLVLQLKKMATKARSRKLSPTPPVNRLSVDHSVEKDEGISDEEDPAELRILLELNEQEASVLRRKVEELEHEGESMKTQLKELTDKLALSAVRPPTAAANNKKFTTSKAGNLSDEKVKVLEDELAELRKKLIEKERDIERLHAELSLTQKRSKGSLIKSKSLDGASEQQNVDLKRQLQLIEQEAAIMSARNQTLEQQQEALQAENKKLQLLSSTKTLKSEKSMEQSTEKISQLEAELQQAHTKIKELEKREGARAEDKPAEKKVTFLGAAAKKEAEALKAKTEELDKLKLTMKKVETERNTLSEALRLLKDDAIKSFRPRTPKKPTDLTTKLQMKKMVEELESEIGEMFVVMKNADIPNISQKNSEKDSLEKIIEDLKKKLTTTEKEVTTEKSKFQEEVTRWEKEKKVFTEQKVACETDNKSLKEQRAACERDNRSLVEQKTALEREKSKAVEEARKLDMQITKLNNELKEASGKQTAVSDLMKKIEELKSQMEDKDKQVEKMKKDLETAAKVEQDKNKLIKEVGDKTKKIADLEKKLKEAEDTCKRNDKMLTVRKERVSKLEKELSEDKEQMDNLTESLQHLSAEWSTEKEALLIRLGTAEEALAKAVQETETKIAHTVQESEGKLAALEAQLTAKQTHIQQLEDMCGSVEGMTANAGAQVELATVREQLEVAQRKLKDGDKELASSKEAARSVETELKKSQEELGKIKEDMAKQGKEKKTMESKISELEIEFQAEKKRAERMKVIHEKDVKNKEIELAALKGKLRTLEQTSGAGSKKILDLKKEYDDKLKNMEAELAKEKKEYDELTGKYEILEEEHVITKAKLTIEKETVQGEMLGIQRDLNNASAELKSLQDTYNAKTDAWIKEKMELQDKLSSLEERLCGGGWEVEKARLLAKLEQRDKEVDHIGKERDVTNHLQEQLKREVEELRKKLDDYDRVTKVQRNLTLDNTSMEQEIKTLQGRLAQAEKVKKSDVADCKLRYEAQVTSIQDELVAQQGQVSRFKRERDMYKQMLEQAQKGMAELKAGGMDKNRNSVSSNDDSEEAKSRLLSLQQQVACLEDGLCEARLEASRVRTELVSERSTAEVKLAEMQSKLNEFEEERLVASGRTKIPGLRTRLELAWQKEREDQQRLLQETSTLARDLRQTLFEVERERDKEKLDMKRRIDQLKKTAEEETDENKKKVTELQCDLLELRDAHAKLRTTNEKLRREKERHDRDREQHKMSMAALKRSQQDEDRKISYLLELVEEVVKMSPDLMAKAPTTYMTPTPPRRNRSKSRSREATPEENSENSEMMLGGTLVKLQQVARDVRAAQITDRQKRQLNSRRAVSTEPRDTIVTTVTPRSSNGRVNSLKKRSISLEQTTHDQSKIWKTDDDSMSSMQSLDTDMDNRHYSMQRETSLDSRLSGGSTQSDVLPASDKKKKKGLFGKLKQLTKSRSIDDNAGPNDAALMHNEYSSVSQAGSDSDMSAAGSKRDLRGRLSDMFHRKGATNGSNTSVNKERKKELSTPVAGRSASLQRPLTRNGSATPTARLSPARSDSSNNSRAQSMTPGLLRKAKK